MYCTGGGARTVALLRKAISDKNYKSKFLQRAGFVISERDGVN